VARIVVVLVASLLLLTGCRSTTSDDCAHSRCLPVFDDVVVELDGRLSDGEATLKLGDFATGRTIRVRLSTLEGPSGTVDFSESAFVFEASSGALEVRPRDPWEWIYGSASSLRTDDGESALTRALYVAWLESGAVELTVELVPLSAFDSSSRTVDESRVLLLHISGVPSALSCATSTTRSAELALCAVAFGIPE
jgi:hypothetical protein